MRGRRTLCVSLFSWNLGASTHLPG